MTHFRELFSQAKEEKYLAAWMLKDKDVTVEIESIGVEEVTGDGGRKEMLPVLHFKGADKGMVLNRTNAKMIGKLHGKETEKWVGKKITLYPTETQLKNEDVECIRVRYEFN